MTLTPLINNAVLISVSPMFSVFGKGSISTLETLIGNECALPSGYLEMLVLASTTDPAQHTTVNLLRVLKTLLKSCLFTAFAGVMYVMIVFLFTGYRRVWRDSVHKLEFEQYTSTIGSHSSVIMLDTINHDGDRHEDEEEEEQLNNKNANSTDSHNNNRNNDDNSDSLRVDFDIE